MGWLFGKKKIPKVPLPQGRIVDEKTLQFPAPKSSRVIEPVKMQEAAGFEMPPEPEFDFPEMEKTNNSVPSRDFEHSFPDLVPETLYVKMEIYQKILGTIDELNNDLSALSETNRQLQNSEFNETANFEKMQKSIKTLHDNLVEADKLVFPEE